MNAPFSHRQAAQGRMRQVFLLGMAICMMGAKGEGFSFSCISIVKAGAGGDNQEENCTVFPDGGMQCDDGSQSPSCEADNGGCDPNALCTIPDGHIRCDCKPGYQGNGQQGTALTCLLVQSCLTANGGCDPNANCSGGLGDDPVQCTCKPGYYGNGSSGTALTCQPLHGCDVNNGGCHPDAQCSGGVGTEPIHCACKSGFTGNGASGTFLVCTDVNECAMNLDSCLDGIQTCVNTPGGFSCACHSGYVASGGTCVDRNECTDGTNECAQHATCTNTDGSYTCACNSGYAGTGHDCYVPFTAVSTGSNHVCALKADGTLWCWGGNAQGELGVVLPEGAMSSSTPVQVSVAGSTAPEWKQVSAGHGATCAIHSDDTLWCWPPDGTATGPVQLGTATWKEFHVAHENACGIRLDGTLWCLGDNHYSQLSDALAPGEESSDDLVQIGTATDWLSVAVGDEHVCGIREVSMAQELYCWGRGDQGQIGDGLSATSNDLTLITPPSGHTSWDAVVAASLHTCALSEGELWCWGSTPGIPLGTSSPVPIHVTTSFDWTSLSTAFSSTCGISDIGDVYCWGANAKGQLGDGTTTARTGPTKAGGSGFLSVSTFEATTCAVAQDGTVECWGDGAVGQMGDGTTAAVNTSYHIVQH